MIPPRGAWVNCGIERRAGVLYTPGARTIAEVELERSNRWILKSGGHFSDQSFVIFELETGENADFGISEHLIEGALGVEKNC